MTWLLLVLTAALTHLGDLPPWKPARVVVVVQNSGALRENGPAVVSILARLLADKPESVEIAVVGFETKFQQLDAGRFRRKPALLQDFTTDADQIAETLSSLVFNGPSPICDALAHALDMEKAGLIVLVSNGIDNASEREFDDVVKQAVEAAVPVVSVYFPVQPPAGGDTRLRKLAKHASGKFIDIRNKDFMDQIKSAMR